jgi:hypothetical protein
VFGVEFVRSYSLLVMTLSGQGIGPKIQGMMKYSNKLTVKDGFW